MINKIHRLLGISLAIATIITISASVAFANDLRIAVAQTKPVIRGSQGTVIDLKGSTIISKRNPRVTLSLKDTDVVPVLRMFADKAGINIIIHDSVKGDSSKSASKKVNLDLVNVPLNDAFRMVMQITDLTYTMDGNTMIVSSSDFARTSGISKQSISTVPVKNVDASLIANFLNQNIFSKKTPGLSNWDVVVTNSMKNELLVFGTANDLAMVKKIVAKFDVPPLNTTFTLKHTTPKEMSDLVCRYLQMTEDKVDQGSQSVQWDYSTKTDSGSSSGGSTTGFAANINNKKFFNFKRNNGIVTGFASESSSSSSSSSESSSSSSSSSESSSSSSSGSSGSSSAIALGTSTVACTIGQSSSSSSGGQSTASSSSSSSSGSSSGSSSSGSSNGSASLKLRSYGNKKLVVSYFPERGTINILGGSHAQLEKIGAFIKENDTKQPQAILDITLLEMSEAGAREFQNYWGIYTDAFKFIFDGGTGTSTSGLEVGPGRTPAYKGPGFVSWTIKYTLTNEKGHVLANPKVILTNGRASTFNVTQEYIDTLKSETNSGSSTLEPTVSRTPEKGDDIGIEITTTPFISPEGYVSLDFTTSYKTVKSKIYGNGEESTSSSTTGQDLLATLLNSREISIKGVRIKDNETLLIGGLVQTEDTQSVKKIPVLGELPLIGALFRSSSSEKSKMEMLILITPRIIKDTEDIGTVESEDLL